MSRDRAGGSQRSVRNWLMIHDLHAPNAQDVQFAECLRRQAAALGNWEQIVYVTPDHIRELTQITRNEGYASAAIRLAGILGVPEVDELVLSQNRVLLNDLCGQLFPESTKICYGDGIGVNFSHRYFADPASEKIGKRLRQLVLSRIQQLLRRPSLPAVKFDHHALLLPNYFDESIANYDQLDRSNVIRVFESVQKAVQSELHEVTAGWKFALRDANQIVVLLTSNFSEARRMDIDREIAAYVDLIQTQPVAGSTAVIIKPHPRDSVEKIERLRDVLQSKYASVFVLNDPLSFYLPFEVILNATILADPELSRRTRVVCVSSACLSLELLYGVRCQIGFGEEIVKRDFARKWRQRRLQHEYDLNSAIRKIRLGKTARQAA